MNYEYCLENNYQDTFVTVKVVEQDLQYTEINNTSVDVLNIITFLARKNG